MKLLHKKNLKEENYDFHQTSDENIANPFKPNSRATIISQILIWLVIGIIMIVLLNRLYIN